MSSAQGPNVALQDDDYDELIYHVPKQKKPTHNNTMGASVSVFPPLAQITQVQKQVVPVTALLEVPADQARQAWQVSVWHSTGDDHWAETPLAVSSTQRTPSTLQNTDASKARLWFEGKLDIQLRLGFTVKFRPGPDDPWRWAHDEQGLGDGTIIYKAALTTEALPDDFGGILEGHDPDIKVKPCESQCSGTRLWALEASVDAVQGDDSSSYAHWNLGTPWGGFLRYACSLLLPMCHVFFLFSVLLHAPGGFHLSVYGLLGLHHDMERQSLSWTRTPFCPPLSTRKESMSYFSQSAVSTMSCLHSAATMPAMSSFGCEMTG